MATLEQVEKLRQKTNVTYDEAKEALQESGDDLLDALIYLEKKGKITPPQNGGSYSSRQEAPGKDKDSAYYGDADQEKHNYGESIGNLFQRFGKWICRVLHMSTTNYFNVWKRDARMMKLPVLVLALCLIVGFWVVLPLLIIGLFFGFRYRFSGPELGKPGVNKIIDSAADAAEQFKKEVIKEDAQTSGDEK